MRIVKDRKIPERDAYLEIHIDEDKHFYWIKEDYTQNGITLKKGLYRLHGNSFEDRILWPWDTIKSDEDAISFVVEYLALFNDNIGEII